MLSHPNECKLFIFILNLRSVEVWHLAGKFKKTLKLLIMTTMTKKRNVLASSLQRKRKRNIFISKYNFSSYGSTCRVMSI